MDNNTRLAIQSMRIQIQHIAFDANLFDRGLANYGWAEKCSKQRKRLLNTIAQIEMFNEWKGEPKD